MSSSPTASLICSSSDICGGTSRVLADAGRLQLQYEGRVGQGGWCLDAFVGEQALAQLVDRAREGGRAEHRCADGRTVLLSRVEHRPGFHLSVRLAADAVGITAELTEAQVQRLAA